MTQLPIRTRLSTAVFLAITMIAATTMVHAQGHPPHPPTHSPQPTPQPPVYVPPPAPPVVPPILKAPILPPDTKIGDSDSGKPDAVDPEVSVDAATDKGIDKDNLPPFVYTLGDSADIAVFAEPPKVPVVGEFFCDWQCEAEKMFPDSDNPNEEYLQWAEEQARIQQERYERLQSGDAIPKDLRIEGMSFTQIKYRTDENGNGRFYLLLEGFGQEAIFSVPADDIGSGIKANLDKVRSVAGYTAGHVKSEAEWNRSRAESGSFTEASTERFRERAKYYEALLAGYGGPVIETRREDAGTAGAGPADVMLPDGVPPIDPSLTDTTVVPVPTIDDPIVLVDAITSEDISLFDPEMMGGWGKEDTGPGSDAAMKELIRTTRDFGGGEVMIDIDIVDNGNLGELMDTMARASVDVGLAVAGAVNPAVGITIAFGKNAKETYDYAISKGLNTRQAIFAATTAGAIGGADTYVVGMGIGKVAGWVGPALKSVSSGGAEAATQMAEHGIGTAGNASGFSLLGNVGKALVDKMVEEKNNPKRYIPPRRDVPLGPGQVTFVMSGGGPWHQNAVQ